MYVIDRRDEANRMRRRQKRKYDDAMKLSICTPVVLSGLPQEPDELERLQKENAELKKKLAVLQEKKPTSVTMRTIKAVRPVNTVHQVYTDGIGE